MPQQPETGGVSFFGDTARVDVAFPCVYTSMYPTGVIAVGDWVEMDETVTTKGFGAHCKAADQTTAVLHRVCGVAVTAATGASTTQPIIVQTFGVFSTDKGATAAQANVLTAVTTGQPLMKSAATAGRAILYTSATVQARVIGHALENGAANLARVFIYGLR